MTRVGGRWEFASACTSPAGPQTSFRVPGEGFCSVCLPLMTGAHCGWVVLRSGRKCPFLHLGPAGEGAEGGGRRGPRGQAISYQMLMARKKVRGDGETVRGLTLLSPGG
jgi:hypothetical protein